MIAPRPDKSDAIGGIVRGWKMVFFARNDAIEFVRKKICQRIR
jgi:hypothetical protein